MNWQPGRTTLRGAPQDARYDPQNWPTAPARFLKSEDWDPDKHPRDERGRFTFAEGGPENALPMPYMADLSEKMQKKIIDKVEYMTGMSALRAAEITRENMLDAAERSYLDNPRSAEWYHDQRALAEREVARINALRVDTAPEIKIGGYIAANAASSARQDPDYVTRYIGRAAEFIAKDEPREITQEDIDAFNKYAEKKGGPEPNYDLKPGTYRPSDLTPNEFISASLFPDYPQLHNGGYTLNAAQLLTGADPNEILEGPKQRSFANCIAYPDAEHDVAVDTWHWRAMFGDLPITRDTTKFGTVSQTVDEWEHDKRFAGGFSTDESKGGMNVQNLFTGSPQSKPEHYYGGIYPWAVEQTIAATNTFNDRHGTDYTPSEFQALVWDAVRE